MVFLHVHILCVLLLLKLTISVSTTKSANLYFSMHKSVQVHLLYYVVGVGVLPSDSPRGIPRRVVMSRNSLRSERDGARNTRI